MKKQRIRLPRRDGLVGEWLLNGNTKDTSGNGYDWTPLNVTYSKTDRGYQTYAGNFNGSSSWITIGWLSASINDNDFSISFSARFNSVSTWRVFYFQDRDSSVELSSWIIRLVLYDGNINSVSYWVSAWVDYHFSFIRNKSTWLSLYVNGELKDSSNFTWLASFQAGGTTIGRHKSLNLEYLNWNLQSVRIFNRALSADEIRDWYLEGLRALGGSSLSGLMDGLVAYYDFRWDANDIISGYDGTVNGATLTTDRFGTANNAYNFNGSSYIVTNSAPDIYWTQNFTMSIWFNPASMSFSNRMKLMNYCESADGWAWDKAIYLLSNGAVWFQIYDWNEKVASTNSGAVSVGNWYQATATYDGNTMKLYLNWELAPNTNTSTAWSYNFSTPKLQIWHVSWTDSRLNWQVWETELFLRALSASEVKALYELSKQSKLLPFC